jgi:GR25 family glycosyltransferase involved in LPS biosynthesis
VKIPLDDKIIQPTHNPASNAWTFFDRIYCISLRTRPDRQREAQAQFDRVGLNGRVEFVLVEPDPTNSERGIFHSHQRCLREGMASGAATVLIFEDDILFDRFKPGTLENAVAFMRSNSDWQVFFLGCFVKSMKTSPFPSVVDIRYRCMAHAYVVTRPLAEKLLAQPWQGIAYDHVLKAALDNQRAYAAYPTFAFQSPSPTSNANRLKLDKVRRCFGGLHWQQKWNEWSYYNLKGLIIGHSLTVAIIILAVVWWMKR